MNWKPNEPNNANDGEDCVFAYDYPWDYGTFTWNDGHCDRAFRYVCQVYKEGQGSTYLSLGPKVVLIEDKFVLYP